MTTRRVRVFLCPACSKVSRVDPSLHGARISGCDNCFFISPVLFSWLQEPGFDDLTDRALLEFAAQAEGGRMRWFDGKMHRVSGSGDLAGGIWDPLVDDGDSLRLAVNLLLQVTQTENGVRADRLACEPGENVFNAVFVKAGDDRLAATRRAVLRAAATYWIAKQETAELASLKELGEVSS